MPRTQQLVIVCCPARWVCKWRRRRRWLSSLIMHKHIDSDDWTRLSCSPLWVERGSPYTRWTCQHLCEKKIHSMLERGNSVCRRCVVIIIARFDGQPSGFNVTETHSIRFLVFIVAHFNVSIMCRHVRRCHRQREYLSFHYYECGCGRCWCCYCYRQVAGRLQFNYRFDQIKLFNLLFIATRKITAAIQCVCEHDNGKWYTRTRTYTYTRNSQWMRERRNAI